MKERGEKCELLRGMDLFEITVEVLGRKEEANGVGAWRWIIRRMDIKARHARLMKVSDECQVQATIKKRKVQEMRVDGQVVK